MAIRKGQGWLRFVGVGSQHTARFGQRAVPAYCLLQQWLILAGAAAFCAMLAWISGVLPEFIRSDSTRITLGILILFVASSVHCAARSVSLSREAAEFDSIEANGNLGLDDRGRLTLDQQVLPLMPVTDYLASILEATTRGPAVSPERSQFTDVFNERLRSGHEFGWFICGVLVKLGMLGTVIGFVMMLGAVEITSSFDLAAVQRMLGAMSEGMAVALYTTIAGMVTAMVLGLQYLLLDRAADELIARAVVFAERQLAG